MGIKCKENIIIKSQDEFHSIDKIITGYAFDIHNEIGRFYDERIYQEVIANKCILEGIKAKREVEVIVTFNNFIKVYKLDLLVDNGSIYELKTVKSLNEFHKQQLINYLLLTGINHGKLINFRTASVEYEFVSSSLTFKDRYDFDINISKWKKLTNNCEFMKNIIINLLNEWGTFLDYNLYNEALIHFLGGIDKIVVPIEINYQNKIVGKQKMQLLNNKTIFHLSAITRAFEGYENNIKLLIKHSNINAVQWINFNHREICLKTII